MDIKKHLAAVSLICLGSSFSHVAFAADEWEFEITPYFFAAGLDGTVGVNGVDADLDMSFSDIWDDLDSALMGIFTASKGRWTYGFEAVYFKLSDSESKSVTGPLGNVTVDGALDVTSTIYVYQGTVAYQVLQGTTKVDLLTALRYTSVDVDFDLGITTGGPIFPGVQTSDSGSQSWTDLVVGAYLSHQVSENVDLIGYVDFGGSSDDDTYQYILGVNWEFHPDFILKGGYRELSWDYDNGGDKWDIKASGPYLGLGIQF